MREAEANATAVDTTTHNMHMLRDAVKEAGVLWRTVARSADVNADGLATEFARLDMRCMETQNSLVGLIGKYDRFLNLVRLSSSALSVPDEFRPVPHTR